MNRAVEHYVSVLQQYATIANTGNEVQIMADNHKGLAVAGEFLDFVDAFSLERLVADRKNLIDEENLRVGVDSYGERQSKVHPG